MKTSQVCSIVALLCCAAVCNGQEMPEMPKPQKEHAWLQKLAGEWDSKTEITAPGQPPMKMKGEESSRMVGGFWYIAENTGEMFGTPYTGVMTLGYDPKSKKYIGTWVDSMGDYMWNYTGAVKDKTIVLEAEGPCPLKPGKLSKFKETIELTDDNHKVFTSSIQEDNGSWTKMVTSKYTRKTNEKNDRYSPGKK
jgi:hypothetical protein